MAAQNNNEGVFNVPAIMQKLHDKVDSVVQGCANDLVKTLKRNNPVEVPPTDDWYSYDHWQIALGTYAATALSSSVGKGLSGNVGGAAVDVRVKSGKFLSASSQGSDISQYDSKKHVSIIVYNPSPYMARLNAGWSPQAEPGWIERCIDEVTSRWGV